MSDDNNSKILIPPPQIFNMTPEILEQLNRSCEAARQNQLNINKRNPVLSALENKWKTMDAFSKRELGKKEY